ncbi:A.superbus venom factor 1 [Merluccius polli]|uniref:A.superbus venom factor 1 n=1 Tax=Merluccius polli TaxID=89951 RepID=A0AA47MA78_MERPO|nr:A.superbus venom factor 1 [Merluccius polli]
MRSFNRCTPFLTQLSSVHLMPEEHKNKFVYLTVNFHGYHKEERVMMVSFQQGYIFIQTEKPIYNPGDTVRIRAYVSSPSFKAFNGTLRVEFQDPEGTVVKQIFQTMAVDGVRPESFTLYNNANEGMWAVIAKFDHRPENTFRTPFQVKKYVLPPFNVTLVPRSSYLSLDQTQLEVEVSASYLYGEPVQGMAYVVFGLEIDNQMKRLPSVKQVSDLEGGVATLTMEEIRRAYPDLRSLLGKSVYVKASVLTNSGSDLVEATKTGIRIVDSPYILTFSDLPKYFKPGPFDFTIQLNYQDGSPASDVPVRVDLIDDLLPTSPSGSLRVSVNMPKTHQPQTIRVATATPGQRTEQQAREEATVLPYLPFSRPNPNFLYISGGSDGQRTAGKTLTLTLTPSLANSRHRQLITHVTYLLSIESDDDVHFCLLPQSADPAVTGHITLCGTVVGHPCDMPQPMQLVLGDCEDACQKWNDPTDYPTRQWVYLPIAGAVVDGGQGVSTGWWACTPHLWGPLLLRDPLQFSLGLQGTQLPCVAMRRHCRSLGGGEAMYWRRRLTHSAPLFTPEGASQQP